MPSMNHSGRRWRRSRPARRRARGDVELERVHELVADHVIGVGERTAERQDDAAPERFGDAARAFAELARDGVGLLEVRMRCVEHERLTPAQLVAEHAARGARASARPCARRCRRLRARSDRSRCRSARSSGPGSRGPCTEPCCGRSIAPTRSIERRHQAPTVADRDAASGRYAQLVLETLGQLQRSVLVQQIAGAWLRSDCAAQYSRCAPATSRRAAASAFARSAFDTRLIQTAAEYRPTRFSIAIVISLPGAERGVRLSAGLGRRD